MKKYEVRLNVDGRSGPSVIIEAVDTTMARRVGKSTVEMNYAYKDKKITISSIREIK